VGINSVLSGVITSPGLFVQHQQQNPFTYPLFQYPSYPTQNFVQVQKPQQQFVAVSRPQQVIAATANRPSFVAIQAQRPQQQVVTSVVSSSAVPVQQQQFQNVFAIHAQRPTPRKIVLPLPPNQVEPYPTYAYEYAVKDTVTGDEKSHTETRTGDNVVGRYTVVEPDGTLRTVSYTAGAEGFNAVVERTPGYAPPNAPLQVPNKVVAIAAAKPQPIVGIAAAKPIAAAVAVPVNGASFTYPYPAPAGTFTFSG